MKQKKVVITSAVRTAIGSFRGSLKDIPAHELGATVVKESIKKSNLQLDEVDEFCLLYTSPSPRDQRGSRMPSSA